MLRQVILAKQFEALSVVLLVAKFSQSCRKLKKTRFDFRTSVKPFQLDSFCHFTVKSAKSVPFETPIIELITAQQTVYMFPRYHGTILPFVNLLFVISYASRHVVKYIPAGMAINHGVNIRVIRWVSSNQTVL